MHGLVLIFLVSILASTVHAQGYEGASPLDATGTRGLYGVRGCTGKLIVEPPFKKGDIE